MLSEKEFTEESLAVLKWLIAIPSITRTPGEEIISRTIYNTVSEFSYFKEHPKYINFVAHDDQKNHSVLALIKKDSTTAQTLVVLCNTDTSSNEVYGTLKSYAFKSEELREKLKNSQVTEKQLDELRDHNNIYGLGSFENKAPVAGMLILIKYYTERLWELPCNLLFVCSSKSLSGNEGIRTCLPHIHAMINDFHLELTLALTFKPESKKIESNKINIYTANMGKVDTSFYIFGQGTDTGQPYKGFSPTLIASKIIEEIEVNPLITRELSKRAIAPTFNYLKTYNNRSPNTPDAVQLGFTFPFINLNILDLLENLKQVAAKAIENSAFILEDRESIYQKINDEENSQVQREAEVLSFSDFFYRAALHYKGNLKSAIEGLIQKCANEDYSTQEILKNIVERLNELARLPRPSVVIFFGSDFIPQQQLRRSNSKDRELYIKINKVAEEFNKNHNHQLNIENECQANESCFIRPVGIDVALKALKDECPMPISTFYNLNAPGITFTYKGGGLYRSLEHIDKTFFKDMIAFIHNLMIEIGPEDKQNYEEKAQDDALEALKIEKEALKNKEESKDIKDDQKSDEEKQEDSVKESDTSDNKGLGDKKGSAEEHKNTSESLNS